MKNELRVEYTPETKILIEKLASRSLLTLKPIFEQLGISYRKDVESIFKHEQPRDEGLRWQKLSPAYAKAKAKAGYGSKGILVRTGRLYESMTDENHEENITRTSDTSATYGSKVPYGHFHNDIEGSRTKMPLRNFSIIGKASVQGMMRTMESSIIQQFARQGIVVERVFT